MIFSTVSEELLPNISCNEKGHNLAAPQACTGLANPTQLQFLPVSARKKGSWQPLRVLREQVQRIEPTSSSTT